MNKIPESVRLSSDGHAIILIDQTLLPGELKMITLSEPHEIYEAIYMLRVRGAPAIGICAAYSMYVLANNCGITDSKAFCEKMKEYAAYLDSSRPTAVNLSYATRRITETVEKNKDRAVFEIIEEMKKTAIAVHDDDVDMCRRISENGLKLLKDGSTVITHCNAGALATSVYGTGLGPLLLGAELGYSFRAYVDETRPLLQGARLTAYELVNAGIDCTLICDNMAGALMHRGKVDACMVGCDRVAVNGDAANKTGTLALAMCAKYCNVPFYVFCPSSTVDLNCKTGADIVIEERPPHEITELHYSGKVAPDGVKCYNPAFDVTPAELITAIVTEKGIYYPNDNGGIDFDTFLRR